MTLKMVHTYKWVESAEGSPGPEGPREPFGRYARLLIEVGGRDYEDLFSADGERAELTRGALLDNILESLRG